MNRKIIYNIYFEDYLSFKNNILDFFNNIKNYEDEIKKVINFKFKIIDNVILNR